MCGRNFSVDNNNRYHVPANVDSLKLNRNGTESTHNAGEHISLEIDDLLFIKEGDNIEKVKITTEPNDDCFDYRGLIIK